MDEILSFSKQFSTVLFFSLFMLILYLTYRKGKKNELEAIKYTIFDEEELRRME